MGIFKLNGIDYMGGGGGGNTNYEELTQLEYDALTEEEKNNGTIYFITDTNSNQDGKFQPVIYSESEREIGVWTDGKPLYEKTVTFTNVSRTGVIDLDLINVDNIFVHDGKYAQYLPLPYVHYDMGNGIGGFFDTDSNGKWIWNVRGGSYASSVTGWMTVRYTKTTDQPGSGIWTPQGVPAVHYDGDEKVVGTWFGETLYEISTICDVSASSSTWSVADFNVNMDDINVITEVKGAYCRTQDKWTVALNYYESSNSWSTHNIVKNATTGKASLNYKSYAGAGKVYVTLRYTKSTN